MKLIFAVTERRIAESALAYLSGRGFPVTLIHEEGGFLNPGQGTLMIGVPDGAIDFVLNMLDEHCGARVRETNALLPASDPTDLLMTEQSAVLEGGVSIFVTTVRQFERFT